MAGFRREGHILETTILESIINPDYLSLTGEKVTHLTRIDPTRLQRCRQILPGII